MLENKQLALVCLFLAAITLAAFWQISSCDFINFDDPDYVTSNMKVQAGVTLEGIRWAFTTGHAANWHPVTWISHMLDVQLFGLNPRLHHFTNLFFHLANTLLLFVVFHRMTKTVWQSAFVAAVFAVHPLHVESVAWVAERKDVLSVFFMMLTLLAYARYIEDRGLKRYLAVIGFFTLGLMSKPMLVTLPAVLLLLDFWPLQRLRQDEPVREFPAEKVKEAPASRKKSRNKHAAKDVEKDKRTAPVKGLRPAILSLAREKAPLFALSALSCVVTFLVQQKGGAVTSTEALPLLIRIENALVSYVGYIRKLIWPCDLAILYPHPEYLPLWKVFGAILILAAVTLTVIWKARSFPCLVSGWFWYTGTLVPVIGLVQVGQQAMADRYTYIPSIGLLIMAGWGIPELLKKWGCKKYVFAAASALYLLCLSLATWTQVGYWRNSLSLFDRTLEVTEGNWLIVNNRGVAHKKLGNLSRAFADFDEAIGIKPGFAMAYVNRGSVHHGLGRHGDAMEDFDAAIRLDPKNAGAYNSRGAVYDSLGNHKRAIEEFDKALELKPDDAVALYNRGVAFSSLGNHARAIEDFDRALEIDPKYSLAYNYRGIARQAIGEPALAIEDFDGAIKLDPINAEAHANRGAARDALGDHELAIQDLNRAIELNPGFALAYNNRGIAYNSLGDHARAIDDYGKAIANNPEYAVAFYNRGLVHGLLGNNQQAFEDFRKAAGLGLESARKFLKSKGMDW